jgi:alanyl-tRNA synthetase
MSVPTSSAIRRQFLEFFEHREHRIVASAPVFSADDPTLLFTNAGMNQFKDVFLGTGRRDYTRAVDTQKCIRVSGKHNDLEEVGLDTYHHTFFEMLGNWSFGDYFKREAIVWAWELLTEVWGLPKDRLWATVFGGDERDGLAADEEAERIWREETDIDPSHVLRFDRRDNFWEMGETGPCGPCSEIHIDRGSPGDDPRAGADPKLGVNAGNERFIELWNLVFMEFNRLDDGSLRPLPARHVDTGMGFERVTAVLQHKSSNYDTDLFAPIFRGLEEIVGHAYGAGDSPRDVAFRVIADHLRAVSVAFADGALPSNTGRGYVLRRLIRRAARYGSQALGMGEPFIHRLVPTVAEVLGRAFGEIRGRSDHIALVLREEEQAFGRTLGRGLVQFEKLAEALSKADETILPGEKVFDLYATYGFPQDLVELMARERSLAVDLEGWKRAEEAHQAASRSEGKFKQILSAEQLEGIPPTESTFHEQGRASVEQRARALSLVPESPRKGQLILDRSPFYPESGGQVGDSGIIESTDGRFRFIVDDTVKMGSVVVHVGSWEGHLPPKGSVGPEVIARVNADRRDRTRRNHTATHLLHHALRQVLGEHVTQQGSYVGPDRLRFDLSHPRAIGAEELEEIEALVNARVYANAELVTTVEELEAAKARGVMALFGEKYDQRVRVVSVGPSTELCGGTHVRAAGDIGPFVVVSEGAIQAGVRRIEALTGPAAVEHVQHERRWLAQAARSLKVKPNNLAERIEKLQQQVKAAKKQKQASSGADAGSALERLKQALVSEHGIARAVVDLPELDTTALRDLGERAKSLGPDHALVLFARDGERVPFLVLIGGKAREKLHAGKLAGQLAEVLGGGGGGRPDRAQGQGTRAEGVPKAVELARESLKLGS